MTLNRPAMSASHRQRGVVLIFALIALVIMLVGAVAISRSLNSTQFNIGNIGFKRDLTNQSEFAVARAMDTMSAGGALADAVTRQTDSPAANYSATKLADNAQGVPLVLLQSDTGFAGFGTAADLNLAGGSVKARYVIDRLATVAGACSDTTCTMATPKVFGGGASEPLVLPAPQAMYRLTVRLTGPRNTMSFFQSTFTAE